MSREEREVQQVLEELVETDLKFSPALEKFKKAVKNMKSTEVTISQSLIGLGLLNLPDVKYVTIIKDEPDAKAYPEEGIPPYMYIHITKEDLMWESIWVRFGCIRNVVTHTSDLTMLDIIRLEASDTPAIHRLEPYRIKFYE